MGDSVVTNLIANIDLSSKVDKVSGNSLVPDTKVSSYDSHLTDKSNPHGVTAELVGAYTKGLTDLKVADLVNSAPETLDTLNELATALGNDPNFATTVATEIGKKVDKVEGASLLSDTTKTSYDNHLTNTSNPHSVTQALVGLSNVVNTGDSDTPTSGGTTKFTTGGAYTELNKKVDKVEGSSLVPDTKVTSYDSHLTNTSNPHSVTKDLVGLGNVDNTSDANKPISTALQTALDKKLDKPNGTSSLFIKGDGSLDSTTYTPLTSTGANSLLSTLPDWTATPTDDVKLIRRDTGGTATFGLVTFSTIWTYISNKISSVLGLTSTSYSGNAASATKATLDANGNVITSTYAKDTDVVHLANAETITGEKTFSANVNIGTADEKCVVSYDSTDKCLKFSFE